MTKVVSSNVDSIGYSQTFTILRVKFIHGGVYDYLNVPPDVYLAFQNSESKGVFVHKVLKAYPVKKVEDSL
jgi:hypothetical protein